MELSVVATLYNSQKSLLDFYRATVEAAEQHFESFEIILVNDGSPDNSLDIAIQLSHDDPRVVVVDLSRNFGHHRAMMTGLSFATGDLVFLLDSDMEERPEYLHRFLERMRAEKCDVVYGVQETRRGSFGERISGSLFYWLMNKLSDVKIPANLTTARLMTRRYVDSLLMHREREIVISGLWAITGYHQVPEVVTKTRTRATDYNVFKKLRLAIDFSTTFSGDILYKVMYSGIFISLISLIFIIYLIIQRLIFGSALEGWTSVIASMWLLGGINILFVGLVGTYVARIFTETKKRPYALVRQVYGRSSTARSPQSPLLEIADGL